MKRLLVVLFLSLSIFLCSTEGFCFEIDGIDSGTEWEGSKSELILSNEESNNNVDFASVKWAIEENSLFICFNFTEPYLTEENTNVGVSFSVEDSEFFVFKADSDSLYDNETYRIEGAVETNLTNGVVCEIRVGFKYGIPSETNTKVRFIDTKNSYSNVYDVVINNYSYNYNVDVGSYDKTVKTTNTTKLQTTKTAKETTKTETTTTEKTTKSKSNESTDNFTDPLIKIINFLLTDDTTKSKASETSTKKVKEKTTRKTNQNKKNITLSTSNADNVSTEIITTYPTDFESVETNYTEMNISNNMQQTISTTKGKKYQMLTAVAGGISLIAVAILGTLGANRKAEKENNNFDDKDISSEDNKK